MDSFNIWGQIQEISPGRMLVIATACPLAPGRQVVLSAVASTRANAVAALERLISELTEKVLGAGNSVVEIRRLMREKIYDERPLPAR